MALDLGGIVERLFELVPAFLTPRLVAGKDRFAIPVLEAFDINLETVADLDLDGVSLRREFLDGHPSFGLQSHIDESFVVLDGDHGTGHDGAFDLVFLLETFFQHGGEIFHGRLLVGYGLGYGHKVFLDPRGG